MRSQYTFTGQYDFVIDSKNRINIPSIFRKQLHKSDKNRFVITRGIDRCIWVYPLGEWEKIEKGLIQRITALNLFLNDIYSDQKIIQDGIIPREVIYSSKNFLEPCMGIKPPKNIWIHITGTDLIRGKDGEYMILEDNLRCPSGVSYMMENRELLKQTFLL